MSQIRKFLLSCCTLLAAISTATHAADVYQLDPQHSFVNYSVKHFDFSSQTGKWAAEGTLTLDDKDPSKSKVDVKINIDNIITGIPELNKHLLSPLFFNSKKYPTATFVSTKVVPEGKSKAKVYGNLTLKGVTKEVVLDVILNKHGVNPINDKTTAGFTAKTEIDRSDFGIKALLPGLGDEVTLDISAEAQKKG